MTLLAVLQNREYAAAEAADRAVLQVGQQGKAGYLSCSTFLALKQCLSCSQTVPFLLSNTTFLALKQCLSCSQTPPFLAVLPQPASSAPPTSSGKPHDTAFALRVPLPFFSIR